MIDAVIFDMDGVLVNNHKSWLHFDDKFLEQFGLKRDLEYNKFVNGRSMEEVVAWLKDKYNLKEDVGEILVAKENWVREVYEIDSQPMVGVENLLQKIKENGFKLALCSGAKMWMIQIILDRFEWHDYFDVVVSADHVDFKSKPDPGIYLHTARLLNIDPENCLVFEDAENGVTAAKNAGMKCIGYKELSYDLPDDLSRADFIVNSFTDKKIFDYLNL